MLAAQRSQSCVMRHSSKSGAMSERSPMLSKYLVVGSRPWNREIYNNLITILPGRWHFVDQREKLAAAAHEFKPQYIFFLHWSWKVPEEIVQKYECICFHMTDVPYGRGGSPLQNLILRGHRRTKLTALRMVEEFDAGPVYAKRSLSLAGSAEEILRRASGLAADMIEGIIVKKNKPRPQEGKVVMFKRRQPEESAIPVCADLMRIYDFIRMLDADGYPHAYVEHNGFRFEFTDATHKSGKVFARVEITDLHSSI
jgi:methionyl-tRNA formyltransferase